jgi:hypothetical protein
MIVFLRKSKKASSIKGNSIDKRKLKMIVKPLDV